MTQLKIETGVVTVAVGQVSHDETGFVTIITVTFSGLGSSLPYTSIPANLRPRLMKRVYLQSGDRSPSR
jgi:hypothetical protein